MAFFMMPPVFYTGEFCGFQFHQMYFSMTNLRYLPADASLNWGGGLVCAQCRDVAGRFFGRNLDAMCSSRMHTASAPHDDVKTVPKKGRWQGGPICRSCREKIKAKHQIDLDAEAENAPPAPPVTRGVPKTARQISRYSKKLAKQAAGEAADSGDDEHETTPPEVPVLPEMCEIAHKGDVDPATYSEVSLVLLVVTTVELDTVLRFIRPYPGKSKLLNVRCGADSIMDTYILGTFGCKVVALAQVPGMGNQLSGAITGRAIDCWKPEDVIMVGIGFGLCPDKHRIGDVMVCTTVHYYGSQRITDGSKGESWEITHRTRTHGAPHGILQRFQPINTRTWDFARRQPLFGGDWVCGDAVVDSKNFAKQLIKTYPQAHGGDMEAFGVGEAATLKSVNWVVVKGICDFAGLAGPKSKEHQALAAAAAVSLVHHVFPTIDDD
ncbi:Nucleoside phosphorylase domain-containing protein [Plasmodiophora brassicae]|nr:hypothetical protein PBRA_008426 [Plasmodiophora brassicae]